MQSSAAVIFSASKLAMTVPIGAHPAYKHSRSTLNDPKLLSCTQMHTFTTDDITDGLSTEHVLRANPDSSLHHMLSTVTMEKTTLANLVNARSVSPIYQDVLLEIFGLASLPTRIRPRYTMTTTLDYSQVCRSW
ncbi:hypothetical protein SCHPADRAFT_233041 [Schizopora paradoxa]|uniref:Uncharacterized protein n=1 Tax=Schizopora paradoxa TaxID=27342 RepID=A0A0H2S2R0_9AGAM|nr:hypothetical protein SCHPADRAFT_233041 [Schizopora paradoxa]